MHPCTYTSQKTKKKNKKWLDGFVVANSKKIVIHDESKKAIYSAAYKIVDDEIDTPMYLVYMDNLDVLFSNVPASRDVPDVVVHSGDTIHPITANHIEIREEPSDVPLPDSKAEGRRTGEILDLFRKNS